MKKLQCPFVCSTFFPVIVIQSQDRQRGTSSQTRSHNHGSSDLGSLGSWLSSIRCIIIYGLQVHLTGESCRTRGVLVITMISSMCWGFGCLRYASSQGSVSCNPGLSAVQVVPVGAPSLPACCCPACSREDGLLCRHTAIAVGHLRRLQQPDQLELPQLLSVRLPTTRLGTRAQRAGLAGPTEQQLDRGAALQLEHQFLHGRMLPGPYQ